MIATITLTLAQEGGANDGRSLTPEVEQAQHQGVQGTQGTGQTQQQAADQGQNNQQQATDQGQQAQQGQNSSTQANGNQQTPPPKKNNGLGAFLLPAAIGAVLLLFIFMSSRSQRRERKKQQSMLDALKKGDKVQSVGGIIGTIVDIREDEIMVKVDENANTRLRFARSAIKNVLESKGGDKEA